MLRILFQIDKIDKVLPLYQELVEKTKQEIGCVGYDLYHDLRDRGHFVFIEEWVDRAALDRHIQTEHFQRLVTQINEYQRKKGIFTHMESFENILDT